MDDKGYETQAAALYPVFGEATGAKNRLLRRDFVIQNGGSCMRDEYPSNPG